MLPKKGLDGAVRRLNWTWHPGKWGSDPRGLTLLGSGMTTKVKICGLKTEAAVEAALAGGADYVGFVFYPPSPRNISPTAAAEIAASARGRAKIVALLVDPDDALIARVVAALAPDLIQLHGHETPERVAEIRARFKRPVMKAVKVETAEDAREALRYRAAADLILFDAKAPKDWPEALPGGNGVPFDWHALDGVKDKVTYVLSGGLTPSNVAQSIRLTGAGAVDVSSGVEVWPGEKDLDLIARFLDAVRSAG